MDVSEPGNVAREARLLLRASRAGTLATADRRPALRLPGDAGDGARMPASSSSCPTSPSTHGTSGQDAALRRSWSQGDGRTGPNVSDRAPPHRHRASLPSSPDPALKCSLGRALHPYAAFYAGFGDFHLWRVRPMPVRCSSAGSPAPTACVRADTGLPRQPDSRPRPKRSVIAHCNARTTRMRWTPSPAAPACRATGWAHGGLRPRRLRPRAGPKKVRRIRLAGTG